MKPPSSGPRLGPMKGDTEKMAIGACSSLREKRSPTVPPETARKALPAKPSRKRKTSTTATLLATACGTSQTRYVVHATR